jgi:anti-sigma factor RsiW
MISQPHHTPEEWTRYVTQDMSSPELLQYREHLQTCTACAADLADICCELALLGVAIPQRDPSRGARDRFMHKVQVAGQCNPGRWKMTLMRMKPKFSKTRSKPRSARRAG